MRGAGSPRAILTGLEKDEEPLIRVSRWADSGGGDDDNEARASSNGSGPSPSKNLAIAICSI